MPGPRPGGTPEEISRGQVRRSGRRPRKSCRLAPCPNGASKKMARGDAGWRKCCGDAAPKNFFDAPLGHGPFGGATGGRVRCADLPPANFLRRPSGTKSKALATIFQPSGGGPAAVISSRRARNLQSGSAEEDGSGIRATGPRRRDRIEFEKSSGREPGWLIPPSPWAQLSSEGNRSAAFRPQRRSSCLGRASFPDCF